MTKKGEIVAFLDDQDRAVYGQVLISHEIASVLIDTEGCFHRVFNTSLLREGEKTPDGMVLLPKAPVAETKRTYEGVEIRSKVTVAQQVRRETAALLDEPIVRAAVKRLAQVPMPETRFGMLGRADLPQPKFRRGHYESWSVPTKIHSGRTLDDAGKPQWTAAFEHYILASESRRMRLEGVLQRLKERTTAGYEAYVAHVYHGMRISDIARTYGRGRGNVHVSLKRATEFVERYMGKNVLGNAA